MFLSSFISEALRGCSSSKLWIFVFWCVNSYRLYIFGSRKLLIVYFVHFRSWFGVSTSMLLVFARVCYLVFYTSYSFRFPSHSRENKVLLQRRCWFFCSFVMKQKSIGEQRWRKRFYMAIGKILLGDCFQMKLFLDWSVLKLHWWSQNEKYDTLFYRYLIWKNINGVTSGCHHSI